MKRVKMVLYGEPGTGKSVFACKSPKPFFITTDRNYEWLEDFGAKEEDHIQVFSWEEAKQAINKPYDEYETIVVDLTEDLFKWCEFEFCKKNKINHVSDMGYGKGYDITRNEFFIEICKLLNKDKNVILIMHGLTFTIKDRKGIEHTHYGPTNRMPDKVLDMIEGRVRYFLRCYKRAEEIGGKLVKKRYLSLIPKENEYGIIRGIDEDTVPTDIPLDWDAFVDVIGLTKVSAFDDKDESKSVREVIEEAKATEELEVTNEEKDKEAPVRVRRTRRKAIDETVIEHSKTNFGPAQNNAIEEVATSPVQQEETTVKSAAPVTEEPKKEMTNAEKLAAIRAKLLARKGVN